MVSRVANEFDWTGQSDDPNDEQFGNVVEWCDLADLDDYDTVLVGEPYDGAIIGRSGAAEGPAAIRAALAGVKTHHFDAGPVTSVGDFGDIAVPDGSTCEVQETIHEATRRIYDSSALPVFLGGDNSLTFPNAAPLLDGGSLGCINFDAHLDVREVRGDATSGTPYRQLFESGLEAYACVGARHFETSTTYHDYIRERGGEVVTAEEVGDDPIAAVDRALDTMTGVDQVYVSLDVDVLDAAEAPGVSAPTPAGVSTRELFRMLRLATGDDRLGGFEVVECAPPLDRADRTVRAAARAIAHCLSARVARGGL